MTDSYSEYVRKLRQTAESAREKALEMKDPILVSNNSSSNDSRSDRIYKALCSVYHDWLKLAHRVVDLTPILQAKYEALCQKSKSAPLEEQAQMLKTLQVQLTAMQGGDGTVASLEPLYPYMKTMQTTKCDKSSSSVAKSSDCKDTANSLPVETKSETSKESVSEKKEVLKKEDVIAGRAWLVRNVLSKAECDEIIALTEARQYELAESYCHFYRTRNNDRFMCEDTELSNVILQRLKHLLPDEVKTGSSSWNLSSLNNRWRFCKYQPGHFFGAHVDGKFDPTPSESSFLTLMIYLSTQNKEFTGGSTVFLDKKYEPRVEVKPEAGLCLVFWQGADDLLHEGSALLTGTKYIMRSDVMYKRQSSAAQKKQANAAKADSSKENTQNNSGSENSVPVVKADGTMSVPDAESLSPQLM